MTTPKQWLSYWKKSLLDSMKAEIDPANYTDKIQISDFSVSSERLKCSDEVERLIDAEEIRINKKQHVYDPNDPDWLHLDNIPVLISPFRLDPLPQRQTFVRERKTLYPFWSSALLYRSGRLTIPSEILPFIPRSYLSPVVDDRIEYTIGDTETMDKACAVGEVDFKNYAEYTDHILHIFAQVAGCDMYKYEHEDFLTDYTTHVLVPDETIGAALNLIKLYENLLVTDRLPPLLNELTALDHATPRLPLEPKDWLPVNELHLGQMKSSFPLSYSQRKSLYTLLANPGERIMAVNGPPGTGKTTLLQSVVANAMVESVLSEEPCVILACSANNQAVTNIIDSFTKKDDDEPEVRWLPGLKGYATYLPSSTKPAETLRNLNYMKPGGEGLFARLETPDYLRHARTEYLKRASHYFREPVVTVDDAVGRLRKWIETSQQMLKAARILWDDYLNARAEFEQNYLSAMQKPYEQSEGLLSAERLEQDVVSLEELTEKILGYFRQEGIFRKIGCWLKIGSALRNRRVELAVILRRSIIQADQFPEKIFGPADMLARIDRLIAIAKQVAASVREWQKWQKMQEQTWPESVEKEIGFFRHNPSGDTTAFYDALDPTLRYNAFVASVHYWEGRWLEETADFLLLSPSDQRKRNEKASKAHWRRRAMLTPCFVSTFYMASKFFDYSRYLGKGDSNSSLFEHPPLVDFIDYLIVDEAGQVPPEVGVGVFALARRAVVVGDVKQIEPVWNILPKVDLGNLKNEKLVDRDEKVAEDIYEPKGFLASSGSIMQMAQNACSFAEAGYSERGVVLVEHRRCYDEIIEYCNELAYHGLLRPLRGSAKTDNPYEPMLCIHVEGKSTVRNKARYNDAECDAICKWLTEQRGTIENKYIDGKDYCCLEDIVGILTPFVEQKNQLRRALRRAGFDVEHFKLGTVHALQGAERPIVLFSAVYGPGDVGTMFFDKGGKPNMLNVAVSRAKDSFIVFANKKIFDPNTNTPSGILARHLKIAN